MNEEQPPLSLVVPSMCPTTPYLLVAAVLQDIQKFNICLYLDFSMSTTHMIN